MITSEVIQRVQSLYSKGVQSDDTRLSSRHIYNKLLTVRSRLLSQKVKKKQRINQWNYQTLSCVELIKAKPYECDCIPPVGCTIYRTKEKLPKPLMGMSTHVIDSVTSITGDTIYNEIMWNEVKYKKAQRFTSNKPDYFIRNEYLFIVQRKGAEVISVTGLFQNPADVLSFPSVCDDGSCTDCCTSPLDVEFPIDEELIDTMIELTFQELLIFTNSYEDRDADSADRNTMQPWFNRRAARRNNRQDAED